MGMRIAARQNFIDMVHRIIGEDVEQLTSAQITKIHNETNYWPGWFAVDKYKISRGLYNFDAMVKELNDYVAGIEPVAHTPTKKPIVEAVVAEITTKENYIPELDTTFVPFGYHAKMKRIIQSKVFLPVFVAGLSGCGKTMIIEQICSKLEREVITVPLTIETNEDDLLGGFRLTNGETRWSNGPVIEAMERGAVLVLDEIDLASHKIMCLQSIIDGKGVYLKKINKYVKHEPGFMVVATANTKGKGKWKGHFVGANIMNEAFLERFGVLFEQDYPAFGSERKILAGNLQQLGGDPNSEEAKSFIALLIEWAGQIRKQFDQGNVSEVISTRRLVHIIKYFSIFENRLDSVREGTNRFNDDNKEAFIELFAGMDGDHELITRLYTEQQEAN